MKYNNFERVTDELTILLTQYDNWRQQNIHHVKSFTHLTATITVHRIG